MQFSVPVVISVVNKTKGKTMTRKLIPLLAAGVLAAVVGTAVFGGLTYTFFNEWRTGSLVEEAYKDARQQSPAALEKFFLSDPPPSLRGMHRQLTDADQIVRFRETLAQTNDKAMDTFYYSVAAPSPWLGRGCLVLILVAFVMLLKALHGLFEAYTGRLVLVVGLMGILGGYFYYMTDKGIYPLGIDLAGGTELIYRLDYVDIDRRIQEAGERLQTLEAHKDRTDPITSRTVDQDMLNQQREYHNTLLSSKMTASEKATEVVRKRVDPTGTKGVPITKFGEDRIRIQLPKASPEDVERIKKAIRTQGRLTFHIVVDDQTIIQPVKLSPDKRIPGYELKRIEEKDRYNPKADPKIEEVVINSIPGMEGSRVTFAGSSRSQKGGYEVDLRFDSQGAHEFENLTRANIKKQLAIVLDGRCYSAPVIQSVISQNCQITGNFSKSDADELSGVLTAGSLPVEVVEESTFVVGPALGHEQIESGVLSTLVAALMVMAAMWLYYRTCGFVTLICLGVNLVVLLGALGFFKATMTLPGIAGIALTLGMAVDANVLIFERIREEMTRGRTIRQAVTMGFENAASAIIDSNLTTLISGIILYYIGTGAVRGFAVTLSIGVLVTLFANLWVCRIVMEWLVAKEAVTSLPMMQLFKETNFDFMGKRKPWMAASALWVTAAIVGFIYLGVIKNDIYDVDFTGGSLVQFNFSRHQEKTDSEVKSAVSGDLMRQFKKQLEESSGALENLAATGKSGDELLSLLYAKVPSISQTQFGGSAALGPEKLKSVAAALRAVLDELNRGKLDLVAQSFGNPVEGVGAERKYRSFTLTTRITDAAAIDLLDHELKQLFGSALEPYSVVAEKDVVRMRLRTPGPNEKPVDEQLLKAQLREALDKTARHPENASVKGALAALQVSALQTEPYSKVGTEGRPYVEIGPLPKDLPGREKVVTLIQEIKLKGDNNRDLVADGPISRKSSFGKQVSSETFFTAILALLGSLVGIFAYLWFRFEFTGGWGFGAIVALLHDALGAVGGICLVNATGWLPVLIDLNVVAAILTIIGYSVNDTIVIFDRIREIKHAHPTRAMHQIINEAVNACLSRTILTSALTLLSVLALLIFGGPTIRGLAFTLLVGMIFGIYSTVFIASPLMMWWINKYGSGRVLAHGTARSEGGASPATAKARAQI